MVKTKGIKAKASKGGRSAHPENTVRIRSTYNEAATFNPSSTAVSLGNLTTSASGIWANNSQVSSLSDMFRLFRINNVKFEWVPQNTTSATATNVPAGILSVSFWGQTDPANFAQVETPVQSNITMPWGSSNVGVAESIVRESVAVLKARNRDLPILQGPSGPGESGYLSTQDDGTQTSYGKLFWLIASAAASTTLNYVLRSVFDLDFKSILDPQTVTANAAAKAAAAVSYHCQLQSSGMTHIVFSDGTLEAAIILHTKVQRVRPLKPVDDSGKTDSSSRSQDALSTVVKQPKPGNPELLDLQLRLQCLLAEAQKVSSSVPTPVE